jgi:trk system potassium uptake protein TrkA
VSLIVHVVIMGCGRVGTDLALSLTAEGHSVAVIDRASKSLERLGPDFPGQKIIGVGFDRDVLLAAGIDRASAFAAVSNGDNSNIIAARVARETFGIDAVVARIYDPGRAEVYARLGIPTVATVRWTADQILRRLIPDRSSEDWRDPTGGVVVAELPYAVEWIGRPFDEFERQTGARIVAVNRAGDAFLPTAASVVQEDDIVHAACPTEELPRVRSVAAAAPVGGSR